MGFLAGYIMQGRTQAVSTACVLALLSLFMPPISIVSSAVIGLITLRLGAIEGIKIFTIALIVIGVMGLVMGITPFALLYGVVLWLPIWLISVLLRAGRQLALAIESGVLLGAVAILGFYLYKPDAALMWQGIIEQMVPATVAIESIQSRIESIARYMTGIVVAGTVFGWVFALFLARWWQASLYNPGGFKTEYLSLSTKPRLALFSLILVAISALSSGYLSELCWNLSILVFVLYSFVGTAVLHSMLLSTTYGTYVIIGMYMTLFLIPHLLVPVAIIGVGDAWLNLRLGLKK